MFITNIRPPGELGNSTPSLAAKLGVAYIIVFEDSNGSGLFEPNDDKPLGASATHCVTYLSGNLPVRLENFRQLKQGFGLSKAEPSEGEVGFDKLVPVSDDTKIQIKINTDYEFDLPNWT